MFESIRFHPRSVLPNNSPRMGDCEPEVGNAVFYGDVGLGLCHYHRGTSTCTVIR